MIDISASDVLKLTLKKSPFEVMVTGEKPEEYRRLSKWMVARLYHSGGYHVMNNKRHYKYVLYTNGYGADRPYFLCEYKGHYLTNEKISKSYSNGLAVETEGNTAVIKNGEILEVGNYQLTD